MTHMEYGLAPIEPDYKAERDNLRYLIKRLCRRLYREDPTAEQAMDYLERTATENEPLHGTLRKEPVSKIVAERDLLAGAEALLKQARDALKNFENDDNHVPGIIWDIRNETITAIDQFLGEKK
jgi:hypothetical protein